LTQNGYVKIEDLHIGKEVGDYFEIDNCAVCESTGNINTP
jgi:hypothetical protein